MDEGRDDDLERAVRKRQTRTVGQDESDVLADAPPRHSKLIAREIQADDGRPAPASPGRWTPPPQPISRQRPEPRGKLGE